MVADAIEGILAARRAANVPRTELASTGVQLLRE